MSITRQLCLPGLHNIRDLGPLPRQEEPAGESPVATTRPGQILRACAGRELTPAGQRALLALDLVRVIDLRSVQERQEAPSAFQRQGGVENLHIPLFEKLTPVYKMVNSSRGFSLAARYAQALDQAAPRFAEAIDAIGTAGPGRVVIHCTAGKDRTGLVAAMLLALAKVPPAEIIADYTQSATAGRPLMERLARQSRNRKTQGPLVARMLAAPPEAMAETLALLQDRHGGAATYLARAGLAPPQIARAVARLIA